MVRKDMMQRVVATVAMVAFVGSSLSPVALARQFGTAGSSKDAPLRPLQPAAHGRAVPNLPLDVITIASGKGASVVRAPVTASGGSAAYAGALDRMRAAAGSPSGNGVSGRQLAALRAEYRQLAASEAQVRTAFGATAAHLRSRGVGSAIMQRHEAAAAAFDVRSAELRKLMAAVDAAGGSALEAGDATGKLAKWFAAFPAAQRRGGAGLSWGGNKDKVRKPALSARAHERLFPRSIQLASAGSISGIALPSAILGDSPLASDLALGGETAATPELAALAASLGNPAAIYNWVRNNIRYTAGYGAMQGAAGTLLARRGNAFDTASLLVAMYRSAGIPARYVYGTVEVPAARAQAWLGVDSPQAMQSLMTQAGIPNIAVPDAGGIGAIRFEHVWVKAYVDYSPSRGAVNRQAGDWVEMDPAFKFVRNTPGLELRTAIPLNEAGVFDGARIGAACTPDFGNGLDQLNVQASYDGYRSRLDAYFAQQGQNLSVGGLLGSTSNLPENYEILLGSLPYQTVAQGAVVSALPDSLRWKLRVRLYANEAARGQGQASVELTAGMADLVNQRVTLSFVPETSDDAAALAAYMPAAGPDGSPVPADAFPNEIPGYLIRVKAELRVGGALVSSGGSFVLGSELAADAASFEPASASWTTSTFYPHAGDYHALAIDAQGVGAAHLSAASARMAEIQSRLASGQAAAIGRDDLAGELLYQTALSFFGVADANSAIFQRAAGVVETRMPSFGRAIAPVVPDMLFGVVNNVRFPGVALDIDRLRHAVAVRATGLDAAAYVRQVNQRNAAYAHQVLDRIYTHAERPGEAVSAVKVLAQAAAGNDPVYAAGPDNIDTVLAAMAPDQATAQVMRDAAAAGYRVLVPGAPVAIGPWAGSAMLIEDTVTGAGDYRLADGYTSMLQLAQGMGWLALGESGQSAASLAPDLQSGGLLAEMLAAMLGADGAGSTVRWSSFPAQSELANGLFLARLAGAQLAQPCDSLTAIVAANIGTTGGLEGGLGPVAAAPVITSHPVTAASAGQAYVYAVSALDPQGLALSYSLPGAPAALTVSATGVIRWEQPLQGTYSVTVRADNGRAFVDQEYLLTVGAEALPLQVYVSAIPAIVNAGGSVKITVAKNGGNGTVTKSLTVDGVPVALNAAGEALVTAAAAGAHPIVASATDSQGTVTRTTLYSVRDAADATAPSAIIASPIDDADITSAVTVTGTAADANFAYYKLLLRAAGDSSSSWRELAFGMSPVNNGALGTLDPSQLSNGIYELLLVVSDINGQQSNALITLDVNGDLKIGQFAISFLDLEVDSSGIPIRVTRTYDTRRKADDLDFGYGWSVDYQSIQLRKNIQIGLQWNVVPHPQQLSLCLVPAGKHKINITLPDGKVQRFVARNAQECALGTIPLVDIKFDALPGTTGKLEVVSVPFLKAQGGQLYDLDNLETWNPREYKLTTEDNYAFYITDGVGITKVVDSFGNTLTYGPNGILHSNGQSVTFERDAAGRITKVTDPAGKRISYAYNASGDLVSVTDRSDAVSRFGYNATHGLLNYTDPRGIVTARYSYDAEGRLIAVTDAAGNTVEMTHDVASNKEVVKDRRGNITTYTYDSNGNITETIDALGHRTTYTYDALGNEATVTNALGATVHKTHHPQSGKQLTEKDALGNSVSWEYDAATGTMLEKMFDARGNLTWLRYGERGMSVVAPLDRSVGLTNDQTGNPAVVTFAGRVTRLTYDSKGNRLTEQDSAGNEASFTHDVNNNPVTRSWNRSAAAGAPPTVESSSVKRDAEGRIIEETDALGNVTRNEYSVGGVLLASIDVLGRKTSYEYDTRGNLTRTAFHDGTSTSAAYDAERNKVSETDRSGRTTRYEYDALNRLTRTIRPDGSTAAKEYDAVGRIAAEIDPKGNRTSNTWDNAGRLTAVTDPAGQMTQFGYDPNGNVVSVTDAQGRQTLNEYDALDRLIKTVTPDGKSSSTAWNVDDTKKSETDASGNRTEYAYDAMGRLSEVRQVNGATTQLTIYGFDSAGNKVSQQDAEGRITRWEFDAGRRMTSRILPGGQRETFAYDAAGNQTGHTDFEGKTTTTVYDSFGYPALTERPDGSRITRTYNTSGTLASATVTSPAGSGLQPGTTSFAYDAHDRLLRQTGPDGSYLAYSYDANGNITERSTRAGTVRYVHDGKDRLTMVTGTDGLVTKYTYDGLGRIDTVVLPNGIKSSYSYDPNGRLEQLLHQKPGGELVAGVRYTLASNGQRQSMQEFDDQSLVTAGLPGKPARTVSYSYDPTGRLIEEQVRDRSAAVVRTTGYNFDQAGNRIQKTESLAEGTELTAYMYDSNDRLMEETKTVPAGSVTSTGYAWYANGNLKSKTTGSVGTFYGWDSDNRLVEVKQGGSEASALTVARYAYDSFGNRVSKLEKGRDGNPDKATDYLVDVTFPYAQVVQETQTTGAATTSTHYVWGMSLIQHTRGGQGTFYHQDGLGSVTALSDASGVRTGAFSYDAFGAVEASNATQTAEAYRFAGEYLDPAVGMQYHRARWYDIAVGRFVSVDPYPGRAAEPLTLNKFLYASADPINRVDPSGWADLPGLMTGIGGEGVVAHGNTVALNAVGRKAFRKAGCVGLEMAADAVVKYGIYVLFDGNKYYVGRSKEIGTRFTQHLKKAEMQFMKIVAKFPVAEIGGQEGKDLIRKAEQYVLDKMKDAVGEFNDAGEKNFLNKRNEIAKKGGRLSESFMDFCK